MLKLTLFGTPQITLNDRNLTSAIVGRPLALLAYLAVTGKAHDRNLLTDLLWTDIAEADARRNLRNALYLLRQAIGSYLLSDRQTVALDRQQPCWVDVTVFAEQITLNHHPSPELLQEILDLYQAEFLAGLHLNDAPVFEAWTATRRYQLQEQAFQGWHWLANYYWETQAYEVGLVVTRRMLTLQPWREEAHRQQMLLLAANGQRSAALAQYEQCRQRLAEELAVEPMAATVALYQQLKSGELLPAQGVAITSHPNGNQTETESGGSVSIRAVSRGLMGGQAPPLPVRTDLGAMPITAHFQGRSAELALLREWLVDEQRRCVAILGIGGQGKTALVAHFITILLDADGVAGQHDFDSIIWRSLLNAPPFAEIIHDWLYCLSDQAFTKAPTTLDQQFARLLQSLQQRRCLLVLDNWESILSSPDAQAYGQLLRLLLQGNHRSSLLLTSREQPHELTSGDEATGAARCLLLCGLDLTTGVKLLTVYGLYEAPATLAPLIHHFSGNPLALKLVIDTISSLFAGDVTAFLAQESHFFGDIGALLDQQFTQLTSMQRTILDWLAIEREPVAAQTLWENRAQPVARRHFWEALRTLQRRSLVETHGDRFGLQNVILEYITERLIEQMVQAVLDLAIPGNPILRTELSALQSLINHSPINQYALLKAQTKEYIRQMQQRLLVASVAQKLVARWGVTGLAARLQTLANGLRMADQTTLRDGYAAANLLALLLYSKVDLSGYDFSHLALRQAYLCDATLQGVNFSNSHFRDALFTDPFEVVGALTFSPDGQWLITGSYDGLIRLWHPQDGRLHQVLNGNQREIGRLVVSPNGEWLGSACSDNQVLIWHLPSLTRHITFPVPVNFPHPLAFSPDSQSLAVDGGDGAVKLLQVRTGEQLCLLGGMTSQPRVLAFSPDGAYLVAGSSEGLLYAWRLHHRSPAPMLQPAAVWRGHQSRILALVFTPDSRRLVSGGADRSIACWSVTPLAVNSSEPLTIRESQWRVTGHSDMVAALALGADGHLLASGSPDRTIHLWDMAIGTLLATLDSEEQRVRALAFTPDGRTLASGGSNQRIYLWDVTWGMRTRSPLTPTLPSIDTVTTYLRQMIYGYANQVRALAFLPQRPLLVSGGTDKALHLWDVQTGQQQQTWPGHAGWIQTLAVSPDGATIASADYAKQVYLWDANDPTGAYHILPNRSPSDHFFIELCFSPDGCLLAGCSGTLITLWSMPSHTPCKAVVHEEMPVTVKQQLLADQSPITTLAFHPQGSLLAGATVTGELYLWRIADGQLMQHISGAAPDSMVVGFSADGQTLVTAGVEETIECWAVAFEDEIPVRCHARRVFCRQSGRTVTLAVDPLGETLATGTYDGIVHLWDWQTGALLHRLHDHQGWITKVSYSPDGKILASAATDGTIKLWSVAQGLCLQTLCVAGPYAGMDITNCCGLTPSQRAALKALGAIEIAAPR